ncbi:DUF4159 domain-containing protein [Rhizobium lentis]|uniref:DUF4159 domain-containing protein n=1 Tax=Rhizobium lentis TaxID=1138194 RepID=UPI001C82CFAE|nr:DUF4159 domain-containing protein [Rhizobium lentis]MBX4973452.1 DUF4159 domain-containing protein [Rhizobium lentis]MBX5082308.1 DUF4159 domain-containing protein [Rhizobium lentis]MBX5095018.1 DUF4159 domain-containing protein [Rhizobium lentis]MBX5119743.1 DUF4159 domain-containing protein [Rhizobium lentis]MBX5126288.1 DUF4159 domain-containing protein [Rhizobium lentis]
MNALPFAFAYPAILGALIALPVIWWLLRLTPPRPKAEVFPPLKILASVLKREETPAQSPWWLTLLRMLLAAVIIFAIADPVFNPRTSSLASGGPLVLFVDNSWAAAPDWERRVQTADALIDDAESAGTPVAIAFTADPTNDAVPGTAASARDKLRAAEPRPLVPDRGRALQALRAALNGVKPGTLAFLTDGAAASAADDTVRKLAELQPADLRLIEGDAGRTVAITAANNAADAMTVKVTRLDPSRTASVGLNAVDAQGRSIANGRADFRPGQSVATSSITAPFEMRNDFARISVDNGATAGAVHLLDDAFKRRRVVLLSGGGGDAFQPLLSPLYYIQRALQPYADLIQPTDSDLSVAIPKLLANNPSIIIMADIGRLPEETYQPLTRWISNGGMLLRFAGPRMAAAPADDPLIPVILRQGERALGGTLSWSEPQSLAEFPSIGPFAGIPRPADVVVKRQVLAEPTPDLAERTWASLADGTPLVTTKQLASGQIVLFHVTAEATWSDLPISGTFVDMLRHLLQISRSGGVTSETRGNARVSETLPPFRMLTAKGALVSETGSARPLIPKAEPTANFDNPPGLYGSEDGFTSLNVLPEEAELKPLDATGTNAVREGLIGGESWSAKPALFFVAFLLLLADSLIVLFMNGAFSRLRPAGRTAALIAIAVAAGFLAQPGTLHADDSQPGDDLILQRLDNTHLAYVVTGEQDVDNISERGLEGLTQFLTFRTTLEPAPPVGLDLTKDELAFYPIIYWPISATAPMPSSAAISRIDAYMRNGGTVLFDTRDQISALDNGGNVSTNGQRLQQILANLDIPPLEPVPSDHVLTKSFYLLSSFPGRYAGSALWIEARQGGREPSEKSAATADGVSPILITGNDFAGAWAVDANGVPMLPTVPSDEAQREYAYRAGVNIMMYMLTGNYKTDQVHVPDLLERLGQ